MKFLKAYKNVIVTAVVIIAALIFTYWWGGNAPGLSGGDTASESSKAAANIPMEFLRGKKGDKEAADSGKSIEEKLKLNEETEKQSSDLTKSGEDTEEAQKAVAESARGDTTSGAAEHSHANGRETDSETDKDKYRTGAVPEGMPLPVEPRDVAVTDTKHTCTLSVRCDTILKNISWLDPEKIELVPENGIIFPETVVFFYEGESVFNVLQREMKRAGIHMEFTNTPVYNSAYIEGIGNLYEFDCGELSGWMYSVNGWFPNYGCSRYQLKDGDIIEWVYTCDLGADVDGYYATADR